MADLPVIKELSQDLINLIAAGEVVERPASVVKELIENAIDAGATSIKIDLIECGIKKITVTDNGCGMTKDQLPLAVKQHATSKIKANNDLFNIVTLGFRGEALASISQVSNLKITSSTDSTDGYYMEFKAGTLISEGVTSMPKGTKVEVNSLFYNTPARFRNLASSPIELSHITMAVERIALANPNIKFVLNNSDKELLRTNGDSDMKGLLSKVFGLNVAKNSIDFHGKNDFYEISGFTSTNNVFRSNRNSINIIVNGRTIRNLQLIYAITDAYKSIIPIGKYPITILNIKAYPELIDVNVHPSKLEIRFTDEQSLRSLITRTIKNALYDSDLTYNTIDDDLSLFKKTEFKEDEIKKDDKLPFDSSKKDFESKEESIEDLWKLFKEETPSEKPSIEDIDKEPHILEEEKKEIYHQEEMEFPKKSFSSLRYIGQYHRLYLLLEDDDDLYIIDQHAAMERWMYETIYNAFENAQNESYELLIPIKLEFPLSEIPLILNKQDDFLSIGLKLEHFGGNTILVREVPIWVPNDDSIDFTYEIISNFIHDKNVNKAIMHDWLAKQLACKRSIKAKMGILPEEVEALLSNLDTCKMPYTCPHGRPTIVKISSLEMEKMFKRVI